MIEYDKIVIGDNMEKILVTTNEYNGLYVAVKSFDDNTVVGVGDTPEQALQDAERKGYKEPVIIYIPEEDVVHIYTNART